MQGAEGFFLSGQAGWHYSLSEEGWWSPSPMPSVVRLDLYLRPINAKKRCPHLSIGQPEPRPPSSAHINGVRENLSSVPSQMFMSTLSAFSSSFRKYRTTSSSPYSAAQESQLRPLRSFLFGVGRAQIKAWRLKGFTASPSPGRPNWFGNLINKSCLALRNHQNPVCPSLSGT